MRIELTQAIFGHDSQIFWEIRPSIFACFYIWCDGWVPCESFFSMSDGLNEIPACMHIDARQPNLCACLP